MRCPIEPGNSPTLRSTTKHKKIPESSFKKENSGKNSAKQARKKYSVQNKKEQLLHQIFR